MTLSESDVSGSVMTLSDSDVSGSVVTLSESDVSGSVVLERWTPGQFNTKLHHHHARTLQEHRSTTDVIHVDTKKIQVLLTAKNIPDVKV